jgi:Zn-dependent alcohol dehydrogenase
MTRKVVVRYRRCPKCKKKLEGAPLYVEQTYSTQVKQCLNPLTGEVDDDVDMITSGYADLYDFVSNMLVPTGKPKIIGCNYCIK